MHSHRKHAGLVLVLLLHLVVIWLWRPSAQRVVPTAQRETEVFLVPPTPVSKAVPELAVRTPPPAVQRPRKVAPAMLLVVPPAPAPVQVAPAPEVAVELFEPAPQDAGPADTTLQERSRKLVAGIDKQLRKESLNPKDRVLAQEPKLAQDIAGAFRDRSFQMSDTKMGNGDTMTRVRTRFGTYCIRTNGNRPTAGRDPFKDSGKQTMVSCPN